MLAHRAAPLRCLLVWAVTTTTALGLGKALVVDALGAVRAGTLAVGGAEAALTALCEVLLLGCLAWAWAATSTVVLELLLDKRRATPLPGVPRVWRRWVLLACGAALAAGLATPAQATPGSVHLDPDGRPGPPSLSGLPMPERPVDARRPAPPRTTPATLAAHTVVVAPGDSLWSIAARDLGPASDDAVAHRWASIYAANRTALGPDPDHVVAGQRLDLPPL